MDHNVSVYTTSTGSFLVKTEYKSFYVNQEGNFNSEMGYMKNDDFEIEKLILKCQLYKEYSFQQLSNLLRPHVMLCSL